VGRVRQQGRDPGAETGFSVEQLREMIEAKPERARQLAARHAWGFGKLPPKK
jgi:hypothetical protein